MLPMEVHDRTFHIAHGDGEGTAVALDFDGKQYLVTANHVVAGIAGDDEIEIFHGGQWKRLPVTLTGLSNADVAVLSPGAQLAHKEMVLDCGGANFFVGEDVFFVGFPHGMSGVGLESPFPTPLLKKGTISAGAGKPGDAIFYLDGHTNPGFSGGPVYKLEQLKPKLLMIISSLTGEASEVLDQHGNPTGMCVYQNSGIITAVHVSHALDLIKANPNGFDLR